MRLSIAELNSSLHFNSVSFPFPLGFCRILAFDCSRCSICDFLHASVTALCQPLWKFPTEELCKQTQLYHWLYFCSPYLLITQDSLTAPLFFSLVKCLKCTSVTMELPAWRSGNWFQTILQKGHWLKTFWGGGLDGKRGCQFLEVDFRGFKR